MWRGESLEELRRCLTALAVQGAEQIIVSRSNETERSDALRLEFPEVYWVEKSGSLELPELQWSALPEARCDLVAFLEAGSIPEPRWLAAHRGAHAAHPEIFACGGPVRPCGGASNWRKGWYWSDYAAYAPGRPNGLTRDVTDANVSYKLRDLREHKRLLDEGAWGWRIRQVSAETSYFEPSASIVCSCPPTIGRGWRQRWSEGRAHGAARGIGRLRAIVTAPLAPAALTWRGWRQARKAKRGLDFTLALPWVLAFHVWWACAELAGSLQYRRSSY